MQTFELLAHTLCNVQLIFGLGVFGVDYEAVDYGEQGDPKEIGSFIGPRPSCLVT